MKTLSYLFLPILLFTSFHSFAQYQGRTYKPDSSIKVFGTDGTEKTLAWCGGFDRPQFSMGDLNHDGKADLVVYERNIGVRTFINTGTGAGGVNYRYDPSYEVNFPAVVNYLFLVDYNRDGIPDLVQQGIEGVPGFTLYKGYYNSSNQLCFTYYQQLYYFNDPSTSFHANAYVNPGDIPAIVDVDNDGDLDFVSYDGNGATINYYRNMQVELGLPPDSVRVSLWDYCWGKILQSYQLSYKMPYNCNNSGLHRTTGTERKTHTGNAICLVDMDGDGDKDYLGGNVSFPYVVYCNNGRIPYNSSGPDSMVTQDTMWQSGGHTLNMPLWPATYNVDINQDGKADLLISPNSLSQNYHCIAYYQNTGTASVPSFTYQGDTFLVDKTIDLGSGAYPLFFDYDKDGKPDLFIGSDGYYQLNGTYRSRISYYRNTSTPGHPSLTLQTTDFLNIDTFQFTGSSLATGDVNNDGKTDLLIGHPDGTISLFINNASSNTVTPKWQIYQTALKNASGTVINVGGHAAPFMYDLNKDGKPDLICGEYGGSLQYFRNVSDSTGKVALQLINDHLSSIRVDAGIGGYYSVPYIGKVDTTGKDFLLVGSNSGAIYRYDGFQAGNDTGTYTMLDSMYGDIDTTYLLLHNNSTYQTGVYNGMRSAPALADIDGDGLLEMVVGDVMGGLKLYKNDTTATPPPPAIVSNTLTPAYEVKIYPNPAKNRLYLSWTKDFASGATLVDIINVSGQTILSHSINTGVMGADINVSALSSGLYVCILRSGGNVYRAKFTIIQ
ncbi:MAG: T9SS type A sorting domain-containing protein [Taibaiella sp.]|nr:T9SS type A sorting domain-containing protein [Taibaiella sp.]